MATNFKYIKKIKQNKEWQNVFNILNLNKFISKKKEKDGNLESQKIASLVNYISHRYPNCPNSEYIRLLNK